MKNVWPITARRWDWASAVLLGRQRRVTFIIVSKLDGTTTVENLQGEVQVVVVKGPTKQV